MPLLIFFTLHSTHKIPHLSIYYYIPLCSLSRDHIVPHTGQKLEDRVLKTTATPPPSNSFFFRDTRQVCHTWVSLSSGGPFTRYVIQLLSKAAATQSIAYAMFAMHGKNSCLYGQRKWPHKTAYVMFAMLAM